MPWLIAVLLGAIGGFAFWRRRKRPEPEASPADELRDKLAESRTADEPPAEEPGLEADLDARRREVHERARGSLDELS